MTFDLMREDYSVIMVALKIAEKAALPSVKRDYQRMIDQLKLRRKAAEARGEEF